MRRLSKSYHILAVIAALVFTAVLCNAASRALVGQYPFLNKVFNYTRIFIYLGIFSVWGVSVSKRVVQYKARRMLIAVDGLILFWLVVREFRFRYVLRPDALRMLWYMYYIPLLLIPLLALFVAVFLGKNDDYRLPRGMLLFCIPTAALLGLVLTNDLHQLAFRFSGDVWSDTNYSYGWLFYAVTGWVYVCSAAAFGIMLKKLRTPKKRTLLPIILLALAVTYGILYAIRVPFIITYLGDLTAVYCLFYAGFLESCIQSGLIQSNTRYAELFAASEDTPVQITDKSYRVHYRAGAAGDYSRETIERAAAQPVLLEDGKRLHTMPVDGGYAVWTEDVSGLLSVREELEALREELEERGALLQLEYEKESEHKTVEERNRLYDLLQSKTYRQLQEIERLLPAYKAADSKAQKREILARIVVLGTYIKRRKDFVLSMEYDKAFPEEMLSFALAESYRALRLFGISGSYFIHTEQPVVDGEILAGVYDFFESVAESVLGNAAYLNLRFCRVGETLRVSILTDCPAVSGTLKQRFPSAEILREDGLSFIYTPKGGEQNA